MNKTQIVLAERDRVTPVQFDNLLKKEGFIVNRLSARASIQAFCRHSLPGLAILEIHLDDDREAGFLLCRELRARSLTLPIVIIGDGDNDIDRIASYRLGADDYVSRRCDPQVLISRVHALLQRVAECVRPAPGATAPDVYCRGRLLLDEGRCRVYWDGRRVGLTVAQFHIVRALVRSSGEIRSLAELMRAAGIQVQPNTVTATIARIRRQFRSIDRGFDAIQNAHGRGYLWLA